MRLQKQHHKASYKKVSIKNSINFFKVKAIEILRSMFKKMEKFGKSNLKLCKILFNIPMFFEKKRYSKIFLHLKFINKEKKIEEVFLRLSNNDLHFEGF